MTYVLITMVNKIQYKSVEVAKLTLKLPDLCNSTVREFNPSNTYMCTFLLPPLQKIDLGNEKHYNLQSRSLQALTGARRI